MLASCITTGLVAADHAAHLTRTSALPFRFTVLNAVNDQVDEEWNQKDARNDREHCPPLHVAFK